MVDTMSAACWKYYMAMATATAAATLLSTTSLTTTHSFVVDSFRLVSVAEAFSTTSFSVTVRKSRYQTTTTTTKSSLERFTRIKSITASLLPNDDQNDNDIHPLRNENNVKKEEETETQQEDTQSWLQRRLQKADWMEIRRDAVLVTCFVLSRFLVYDILTSTKVTPGWVIQDAVWLTGTFSSATVLVIYWTMAGLLSKSFEPKSSVYGPVQVLVNVALCCPIWLATEHLLQFGPPNIGGDSLSQAIATGFLGLASFMTLARALTSEWE
ncbi:hypothetical protein IV203_018604 [Nitzschia inconspicua]|uniref:Uncharacterized protein n=1 Tax=Nitzschia inconspicua TaxID=303405 RepID=A0A9K3Q6I2_9STRA|nr:hypothetical protein IV203_018604 [Nitzschia inconspicua]